MVVINKLSCPSCGAKIEKEIDENRYICPFCGNSFLISNERDTPSQPPSADLKENLPKNFPTVDRISQRIQAELNDLYDERKPYQKKWNRLARLHSRNSKSRLWKKISIYSLIASFITFIFAVINDKMVIGLTSMLIFISGVIILIYFGIRSLQRKTTEKEYASLARIMFPLDEKIQKKQKELKTHQRNSSYQIH